LLFFLLMIFNLITNRAYNLLSLFNSNEYINTLLNNCYYLINKLNIRFKVLVIIKSFKKKKEEGILVDIVDRFIIRFKFNTLN
jgi:hypothetical protein